MDVHIYDMARVKFTIIANEIGLKKDYTKLKDRALYVKLANRVSPHATTYEGVALVRLGIKIIFYALIKRNRIERQNDQFICVYPRQHSFRGKHGYNFTIPIGVQTIWTHIHCYFGCLVSNIMISSCKWKHNFNNTNNNISDYTA